MPRTLLLTRARLQAKAFAAELARISEIKCHIAPMQEMRDLPVEIDFDGVDALVFTSKNGVKSFAQRWQRRGIPVYCVGPATADMASDLGMVAHAASGNLQSLAALINSADVQHPLHLHGLHKAGDLPIKGRSIAIYEQVALPLDAKTIDLLAAGGLDAIALFSPRSAQMLADVWQANWPKAEFYCISKATAEPVENIGKTRISSQPSANAMLALLID